jgi:hypothetical protein
MTMSANPTGRSILLIETNSTIRQNIRRHLDAAGYSVFAACSLGDALARLRSIAYDLVVWTDRYAAGLSDHGHPLLLGAEPRSTRTAAGSTLFLPGPTVLAKGVLVVTTTDPDRARRAIADAELRLERMVTPH